jgi:hypothetical protein
VAVADAAAAVADDAAVVAVNQTLGMQSGLHKLFKFKILVAENGCAECCEDMPAGIYLNSVVK